MGFKMSVSEEIYEKLDFAKSISSINPDESIKISTEAYELARANRLDLEEAYALLSMALASRVITDISNMLDCSYRALKIFREKDYVRGQGKALNLVGIAYFYGSIYEEALNCFFEADYLVSTIDDDSLKTSILNNIGEVYKESEIYDKAIEYYIRASNNVNEEHSVNQAVILTNIGEIYFHKKEFSKALKVYDKSYRILNNCSDMVSLGELENKIGKTYFALGDLEKAEICYLKSMEILEDINNKYYSIDTLLNLGNLYIKDSFEKGLVFFKKAVSYAKDVGSKKKLCDAYGFISNSYENQEDYKNAIKYYKKYTHINEEIVSSNLKSKLEILNIDFMNLETIGESNKIRIRLENEIARQKNELGNIKQTNESLEKQAYEDELTGLKNRRSINLYIKNILEKNTIKDDTLVLFMIDIDHFKRYNDYWGHLEGDLCLSKISNCIKEIQESRGDFFGRYGGEEFVYISSSINYKEALKLGNTIRSKVEKLGIYYMYNHNRIEITVSVGGVLGNIKDFNSMAEVMELADKNLYKAKDKGRNITMLKDISVKEKE